MIDKKEYETYEPEEDYEERTKKAIIGKKVVDLDINGFGIRLLLDDGTVLDYESSDGGYSCWEIYSNPNKGK